MTRVGVPVVWLALLLVGCAGASERIAAADAAELAETLAGRNAVAPVDCIDTRASLRIVGDTLIASEGGRVWRNENAGCVGLSDDSIIVVEPTGGQLCRGDRFRTIPRGGSIASPFCPLGRFVPYVKARND